MPAPLFAALALLAAPAPRSLDADLLVVGGNESAVAAAVQAARLGVGRVVLVSDTAWLGGQFSSEGCGAIDEWTTVGGKRVDFPRSGMFLEVAGAIEETNRRKYGTPAPGNCFCACLTVEPKEGARIFEELVAPEVAAGRLSVERNWDAESARVDGRRVAAVTFARGAERLTVSARLTIDASDWGDVIRLSGARYFAGPDPKSRFGEPSAPDEMTEENRREMNPLTYCVTLRGGAPDASEAAPPDGYERRNHLGATRATARDFAALGWPAKVLRMNVPAFADTAHEAGPYSPPVNVYTHRRLVDAARLGRPAADECLFLNWPTQDYPLDRWPRRVADELDRLEPGASAKNLAALTPAQRRVVLADAKRHALGLLHYLREVSPEFRRLRLTDEYGTPDRLPPKPYVREGLRLAALDTLREQDIRTPHPEPKWAARMPADGVFGFQFNIDFHPTRRAFLAGDDGPWATVHTPTRNWSTHTDRAVLPLRCLVPAERDGLLGASKNLGVSSVVSSALRLQGQMVLCGQAAGTVAAVALRAGAEPRGVAADPARVRDVQRQLLAGTPGKPGVLIWPYHDLPPTHRAFAAANAATLAGHWKPEPDSVFFRPDAPMSDADWRDAAARAGVAPGDTPATRANAVLRLAGAI